MNRSKIAVSSSTEELFFLWQCKLSGQWALGKGGADSACMKAKQISLSTTLKPLLTTLKLLLNFNLYLVTVPLHGSTNQKKIEEQTDIKDPPALRAMAVW